MNTGRRNWAWPLAPLYGAALGAGDLLRAAGFPPKRGLGWPVISVGSLSAGGAGKTPVTIALAKLLRERGWRVDVLSRGYRRAGTGVERVEPEAENAAQRFGDEPVLIAERAGVPVWVGSDRYAAGSLAEGSAARSQEGADAATGGGGAGQPSVHLLDDGMQHRALRREFDLVLVTEQDLRDTLLPVGNLREPLTAMRRADALAVREDEVDRIQGRLRELRRPEVPVWTVRRTLRFPAPFGVFGAGLRPLVFCALARPENFAAMLTGAGCGFVDTVAFPDHHRYGDRDLELLARTARRLQATGLITTEKDAVKLPAPMRARLQAEVGPLMVVGLDVQFVYESPVTRTLESCLRPGNRNANSHVEARAR